ncbi:uncharacterized protein BX664DRAFT_342899 [Halteromyces radiatus]|uniref:uncharacterized protein n=1 Tax=Halteromyces radiatus TaxID=101107 RepID=UPI00221EF580|nr:uncharacterized protein BX664DRAFT_342899 [Halteromyces radiatus]KAI8078858.1 hypothetical protein BX664DRAFT_342899 [Halteromyces radiatus]
MSDSDEQLQANTYIWSQSSDQVTISFLVPESSKSKDLDIVIDNQYVKAGLKGQEPVFKAKLFATVNHFDSLWQLEKNSASPFSSLTASPSLSIASSYAFMSPNHSPNSSMILPAPALTESLTLDSSSAQMADLLQQTAALGTNNNNNNNNNQQDSSSPPSSSEMVEELSSQPSSPVALTSPVSIATPPPIKQQQQQTKYRILTIHLEKENEGLDWAIPVSSGWKSEMDLDVTSAYHLAHWHETRMGNLKKALDYYLNAAERGHTKSMVKAAALYESDQETVPNATTYPEKDAKKSFEWYKRAADLPSEVIGSHSGPDPLACYVVGTLYGSGSTDAGIEKNYEQALYYYNRCMLITAPHIDLDFGLLDQQHIPKSILRNHTPYTRDERYFSSSAFQTGLIYLYGSQPEGETVRSTTVVEVDAPLALRYWKEAAVLGHAQACYNIGIVYANGMGVDQDLLLAGKWFGRALKLDTTQRLVAPTGVPVIMDWDAQPDKNKKDTQKKKTRRKKRKSKKQQQQNKDAFSFALALGGMTAMAGIIWWWYHRSQKN